MADRRATRRVLAGALVWVAGVLSPSAGAATPSPAPEPPTTTTTTPAPRPPVPPAPPPRPRRLIGCRAASPNYRTAGPSFRRRVALTFDDGPGVYTPSVLAILARYRVSATFFLIGEQVRGREALLRRALGQGNVLGNHTFTHALVSGGGYGQIRSTQAAIVRATGYTPCVFRAPYGAVSSLLIGQARSLGMDTIEWNVDPRDWARPGAGTIYSRVVGATRPGAIILMHDGGGFRGQTVAALPGIIRTLRAHGYDFATVPDLLGLAPRYTP